MVVKKQKTKAVIYSRVSSAANKDSASVQRQEQACRKLCTTQGWTIAKNVAEVISGSLPKDKRHTFCKLLETCSARGIKHVVVEGSRTLARSARTAQDLFDMSKKAGVTITTTDIPGLLDPAETNPASTFLRHVIFAYVQLERDMVVHRLQDGLARKRYKAVKESKKDPASTVLSQQGQVKINGRRSLLEMKSWDQARIRKHLGPIFKDYAQGKVTAREMAPLISKKMKLGRTISHETARRMYAAHWA
ncbi:unnamed protein product [Symbiodinium sp. CCMP2592]|nr:unnamed protein product [Symbiodinium sp. CCMP2592]